MFREKKEKIMIVLPYLFYFKLWPDMIENEISYKFVIFYWFFCKYTQHELHQTHPETFCNFLIWLENQDEAFSGVGH